MMKKFEGYYSGEGLKVAIVASRFNSLIVEKLIEGAEDGLLRHGVQSTDMDLIWVPGAFEIPLVAKKLSKLNRYDAIICLGAVIRGDTSHYDLVSSEVTKGIAQVSLDAEIPVIFGVVTTENLEQALERAGTKAGNKGFDAALSAIEMSNLIRNFKVDSFES